MGAPETRRFIRERRATRARTPVPLDFEDHARLYREAWSDPLVRWLLSTVPSAMIVDDHEVHEAWDTSAEWLRQRRASARWSGRAAAAIAAYWCYQHLGNLSPPELAGGPAPGPAAGGARRARPALGRGLRDRARPRAAAALLPGARTGAPRRARRALAAGAEPPRALDPDALGWEWLERELRGGADHLLVASSIPVYLPAGLHDLEAWSEAVAAGAWGRAGARLGERVRRRLSLEHWAAFGGSFDRLLDALAAVGAGTRGRPPASILVLAGEVHHGWLARVRFPAGAEVRSAVWQLVSSPLRNPLRRGVRARLRLGGSRPFAAAMRLVARAAGVPRRPARWRRVGPTVFAKHVATVTIDGPRAWVALKAAEPPELGGGLRPVRRAPIA